jgi:hypothetical protein
LLQLTILAAQKLTRAKAKAKNIFFFLRASGNIEHFWCGGKLLNRLSAVAAHAISRKLYAIVATRHPHARRALIFVALIIKIVSCNNKKFHGLPLNLL